MPWSQDPLPFQSAGIIFPTLFFYHSCRKEASPIAKGKNEYWLTPDGLLLLEAWARDGLTMEQIAHNCGCAPSTLHKWRNEHPEISEALKKGQDVVDVQVENALLKTALGYSYDEVTQERVRNRETGQMEMVETKRVTKRVLPNTTAQIFWLKNRRPDQWRSKPADDSEEEDIDATREEVYGDA